MAEAARNRHREAEANAEPRAPAPAHAEPRAPAPDELGPGPDHAMSKQIGLIHQLQIPTRKESMFTFLEDVKIILQLSPRYDAADVHTNMFAPILNAIMRRFIQQTAGTSMALTLKMNINMLEAQAIEQMSPHVFENQLLMAAYDSAARRHLLTSILSARISNLTAFDNTWQSIEAIRKLRIIPENALLDSVIQLVTSSEDAQLFILGREWHLQPPHTIQEAGYRILDYLKALPPSPSAFYASSSTANQHPRQDTRTLDVCTHCSKRGHTAKNCFQLNACPHCNAKPSHQSRHCPKARPVKQQLAGSSSAHIAITTDFASASVVAAHVSLHPDSNVWIVDSGASRHMTPTLDGFINYTPLATPLLIRVADGSTIEASGTGNVELGVSDSHGNRIILSLSNVLHVPKTLQYKLLSINCLMQDGCSYICDASTSTHHVINAEGARIIVDAAKFGVPTISAHALAATIVQPGSTNDAELHVDTLVKPLASHSLRALHEAWGHLNYADVLNLNG